MDRFQGCWDTSATTAKNVRYLLQTDPKQWFGPTKENPANDSSRGLKDLHSEKTRWFEGPGFLWKSESEGYLDFKLGSN